MCIGNVEHTFSRLSLYLEEVCLPRVISLSKLKAWLPALPVIMSKSEPANTREQLSGKSPAQPEYPTQEYTFSAKTMFQTAVFSNSFLLKSFSFWDPACFSIFIWLLCGYWQCCDNSVEKKIIGSKGFDKIKCAGGEANVGSRGLRSFCSLILVKNWIPPILAVSVHFQPCWTRLSSRMSTHTS